MQFLNALASCPGANPAVLVITPGYCDSYVPAYLAPELPMVLCDLYQPDNLSLGYSEPLQMAANTDIAVTALQAVAAEKNARGQATSRLWFHLQTRTVTASKFKRACHTNPAKPSLSLIMSIAFQQLHGDVDIQTQLWRSIESKLHFHIRTTKY